MTQTPYGFLPSPASPSSNPVERLLARLLGWLGWVMLAALGLVFLASLLVWLLVMLAFSLVSSLFTGRPAAVTLLWQRYRAMARQHWPQSPARPASPTPRADAAQATGAAGDAGVQDVRWRDIDHPSAASRD